MNAEKKCRLSAEYGGCVGFLEGAFIRFYQQGLFTWNRFSATPLKVSGRQVKKLDGKWLLSGGLPLTSFLAQGLDVKIYKWGAVLDMTWENDEYEFWYHREINRLISLNCKPTIMTQDLMGEDNALWDYSLDYLYFWSLFTSTKKEKKVILKKVRSKC